MISYEQLLPSNMLLDHRGENLNPLRLPCNREGDTCFVETFIVLEIHIILKIKIKKCSEVLSQNYIIIDKVNDLISYYYYIRDILFDVSSV